MRGSNLAFEIEKETLLKVVRLRFGDAVAEEAEPRITAMKTRRRFDHLLERAVRDKDADSFRQALENI